MGIFINAPCKRGSVFLRGRADKVGSHTAYLLARRTAFSSISRHMVVATPRVTGNIRMGNVHSGIVGTRAYNLRPIFPMINPDLLPSRLLKRGGVRVQIY